jgi:error-prone DNA polymerase
LYGFPESHAASFALLVYASAYLKAHYPAAFYTAMLNNQPMGFYHPATLVKDAQRHGVRFAPIDVQVSGWECRVEPDGRVRLGLMYVNGLRQDVGKAIASASGALGSGLGAREMPNVAEMEPERCPKCGCDDRTMIERTQEQGYFCNVCAHEWPHVQISKFPEPSPESRAPSSESQATSPEPRYRSIEDLVKKSGLRRDELATLAEIGALNSLGYDRRSALWQIERAVRPSGELFEGDDERTPSIESRPFDGAQGRPEPVEGRAASPEPRPSSPLRPMTPPERVMADYAGTSLTIGPHPMALRRTELALRGVLRARDLPLARHGRRVRVAGAVITRQRPGTAKGFVFLTLEDETGIANIIVQPDLFTEQRTTIVGEPYLLVEGTLQIQEGVTSVKADRVLPLIGAEPAPDPQSHDFR